MQGLEEYGKGTLGRALGSASESTVVHHEETNEQDRQAFAAGQQVIWLYKTSGHHRYRIAVEIVQMGLRRARIRSLTTEGQAILRWVKPSNLRQPGAGELPDPYPSSKS